MPSRILTILEAGLAVFGIRSQYEQPKYDVIERLENKVEIRRYGPRLAAETTVTAANESKARNEAFFILANYIFGGNRGKVDIAMTSPVETGAAQQISMTAPVETNVTAAGRVTMRFFLPASITVDSAPKPDDPRVTIVDVPPETLAVVTFSGLGRAPVIERYKAELGRVLSASSWRPAGQAFTLFYDPPFTIPFLRRNEVAQRVTPS